ncbi:rRNA adenine dimethylase [Gymnopus androsaceus JB14]|uniref:rRNA adenine N(6)-methyltransferase n=1 Tax=Gymnopus androsaceus JB14 TaxID=1447944 RepID=A0A6A4HFR3_9AGAR|nr:rRNA adenine dimethylase [Gymnopus androsaceus JB14]
MPRAQGTSLTRTNKSSSAKGPLFDTERFGQHILKHHSTASKIASLAPTDHVLEIGPDTGNLTVKILEQAQKVTAVEADSRLAAELTKRVQGKPGQRKLDLIIGDFVHAELPAFDVCISNTPYQISSIIVFRLLSHRPLPRVAILMFQREFALRLMAKEGTKLWSRLSANVQLYAKVDYLLKVGKSEFQPPPQVESSVVRIKPIYPPPSVRFEEFDGLNRIIFTRRNKTLRANFKAKGIWAAANNVVKDCNIAETIDAVLTDTGNTEKRAAQLGVDELLK